MSNKVSRFKAHKRLRHPDHLVECLINGEPEPIVTLEILHQALRAEPDNLKAQALLALQEASQGLRPIDEASAAMERAYPQKSHVDLHLFLLLAWGRMLASATRTAPEAIAIANQIASLISARTPAEIRVWARFLEARIKFQLGDIRSYERLVAQVPGDLPASSAHYRRVKLVRAMDQLELGKLALVEDELEQLAAGVEPIYQGRIALLRLINSAMVGSLAQAEACAAAVARHPSADIFKRRQLEAAKEVLMLMTNQGANGAGAAQDPAWARSTRALLAQDALGALHWARQYAGQMFDTETMVGVETYALIRAELACRHGDAALGLLQARSDRGTVHYFDDLFLARAHLLLGSKDRAAEHFALLHQAVHTYGATGRLEFELRLAAELSSVDLIELSRASDRVRPAAAATPSLAPPRTERHGIDRLISGAREMQAVKDMIVRFADVDLPCLVTGETGTGKERVAQALHEGSARRARPFVEINCGALSDTLIESELFGHKRGAFTGAQAAHPGLFREAGGGTIFLDEIGEISPRLQVALLRVLETGEARAVGGSETYKINCRIVAATNADLARRVEQGSFRADLMYRLERLQIHLPPLRARPDDIIILAEHFLNLRRPEGKVAVLLPRLKARLREYAWPGNVRELRNVIERMRILNSDKLQYDVDDLDSFKPGTQASAAEAAAHAARSLAPHGGDGSEAPGERRRSANPPAPATQATKDLRQVRGGDDVAAYLESANSTLRRLGRLRSLFGEFPQLKVSEVAKILGVTRGTAARYLETLSAEGLVRKVSPTASLRSQYYVRNGHVAADPE